VALSASGGYGAGAAEHFGIEGLLSVRRALATVQGDGKQTETTVTLEEVNIRGILQVGRIVLHLVSTPNEKGGEPSITPAGSLIEGLTVKGKPVTLGAVDPALCKYTKYKEIEKAYAGGLLKGLVIDPATLKTPAEAARMSACVSAVGDVKTTLYPAANGMYVKDFGTLYFGEYRISRYARRLTMLRVELGCEYSGSMSFADGAGNGHWEPPI
jgi:hypothetical protein